jgi:hypothetical protein
VNPITDIRCQDACALIEGGYLPEGVFKLGAGWLEENWHVYLAFEQEALALIRNGRTHYSARTILEVLRHESAISEGPDKQFKLNNHAAPELARVFALLHPEHIDFFEYRAEAGRVSFKQAMADFYAFENEIREFVELHG